jgi:Ni2+-binding GTPase involved in maturation of urease and hydrogenase
VKRVAQRINPFELFTYQGPKYFCDRENETQELLDSFQKRRNIVLSSKRRLGKTTLIHHWHQLLDAKKKTQCFYLDILNTNSDSDFINKLISEIITKLREKETPASKLFIALQNLRPKMGFDPHTGLPNLSIKIKSPDDVQQSISSIFNVLSERKEKIQISIDEFQQILSYGETQIDSLLKSHFHLAKNIHFLFASSEPKLLSAQFSNPQNSLFSSTQFLTIGKIDYTSYFDFIKKHFEKNFKKISDDAIHNLLKWTKQESFYTHFICNTLFNNNAKSINERVVEASKQKCLKHFEPSYLYFKKILSWNQWKLLVAISKEGEASNILSKSFINKYNFSPSSTSQSLNVLIGHQLIYENLAESGSVYSVYDVFFSRWLERLRGRF